MSASPFLLIIEGPMGSGKSAIGDLVHAGLPESIVLNTEIILKDLLAYIKSPAE